jgi:hypothetical protein
MREDVGFRLPLSHSSSLESWGYAMFRMQHGSTTELRICKAKVVLRYIVTIDAAGLRQLVGSAGLHECGWGRATYDSGVRLLGTFPETRSLHARCIVIT